MSRQKQRQSVVQSRQIALRGMDAQQAQEWELAERLYREAIEICPIDERARHGYAEALWHRGDHGKAIEQMGEAVRLGGDEATMLVRLGEMYLAEGDLQNADHFADQAVNLERQSAQAYRLQGDVLRAKGAWRRALASYHRSLSVQDDYPEVQMAVAQLYLDHDRPQRALSTLQSLLEQYPPGRRPVDLLYWQGLALKSLGRYEQSATYLAEADSCGMRTPDLLYHLAEARIGSGDLTRAQLTLKRAQKLSPNHPAAAVLGNSIEQSQLRMARLRR